MSVNAYSDGAPTDALSDIDIAPARQREPVPRRGAPRRPSARWRLTVVDEPVPESGARRTRSTRGRAGPADRARLPGLRARPRARPHRRHRSARGGADRRRRRDGRQAACARINDANRDITVDTVPRRALALGDELPRRHPAFDPIRWERFFNLDYSSASVPADCTDAGFTARRQEEPRAAGRPVLQQGQRVRLRAPRPRVRQGRRPRGDPPRSSPPPSTASTSWRPAQLRFWSLCTGESRVTLRTPDCLADRQVPIDAARRYTIVVSRREDRPANATAAAGSAGWTGASAATARAGPTTAS